MSTWFLWVSHTVTQQDHLQVLYTMQRFHWSGTEINICPSIELLHAQVGNGAASIRVIGHCQETNNPIFLLCIHLQHCIESQSVLATLMNEVSLQNDGSGHVVEGLIYLEQCKASVSWKILLLDGPCPWAMFSLVETIVMKRSLDTEFIPFLPTCLS